MEYSRVIVPTGCCHLSDRYRYQGAIAGVSGSDGASNLADGRVL